MYVHYSIFVLYIIPIASSINVSLPCFIRVSLVVAWLLTVRVACYSFKAASYWPLHLVSQLHTCTIFKIWHGMGWDVSLHAHVRGILWQQCNGPCIHAYIHAYIQMYIHAVLCYLMMFRLEELGMGHFKRLVNSQHTGKMHKVHTYIHTYIHTDVHTRKHLPTGHS